jgi:hypothetical protein
MAKDYDEIAVDLERGAIKIEHPGGLPWTSPGGYRTGT